MCPRTVSEADACDVDYRESEEERGLDDVERFPHRERAAHRGQMAVEISTEDAADRRILLP